MFGFSRIAQEVGIITIHGYNIQHATETFLFQVEVFCPALECMVNCQLCYLSASLSISNVDYQPSRYLVWSLNGSKYKNKNIQDWIRDYLPYQPWIQLFLEDGDQVGGSIETSAPAAAEMRGNSHGPASGNFIPPPRSAAGDDNEPSRSLKFHNHGEPYQSLQLPQWPGLWEHTSFPRHLIL